MTMRFTWPHGSAVAIQSERDWQLPAQGVAMLFGFDMIPDTVFLPDELGGTEHRVVSHEFEPCPCGLGKSRLFVLAGTDIAVFNCKSRGFLWVRHGAGA